MKEMIGERVATIQASEMFGFKALKDQKETLKMLSRTGLPQTIDTIDTTDTTDKYLINLLESYHQLGRPSRFGDITRRRAENPSRRGARGARRWNPARR